MNIYIFINLIFRKLKLLSFPKVYTISRVNGMLYVRNYSISVRIEATPYRIIIWQIDQPISLLKSLSITLEHL